MGLLSALARTAPRADVGSTQELLRLITSGSYESETGEVVTPQSAMQAATVFACVRVIMEDIGKLPCHVYRRLPNGGKERATNHPVYGLLRRIPNAWQTPMSFFGSAVASLELIGAGAAYITRDPRNGRPLELLPINGRLRVEQDADWKVRYYVRDRNGGEQPVDPKHVLYIPGPSLDGVTGMSTIGYMRETIGTAIATERHASRFFRNSARPSIVVERPKDAPVWSPEAADKFVRDLADRWGGKNSSSVGLLEEGMTAKALTISAKDAQFLETRGYNRSDICGFFRVAPHKVADLSRSTNNNIEHQGLEHLTDCLLPRLVRIEQALSRALLTPDEQEEYVIEFLVDSVLRADFKTRMEGYGVAIQNGMMAPNEARVKENENPREGGDHFWRPANMVRDDERTPTPPKAD
ncbi:MAG: phage portal protein [Gemmatimonas sp.]|nr:phage portal protein [Gemmatimonas sp.]